MGFSSSSDDDDDDLEILPPPNAKHVIEESAVQDKKNRKPRLSFTGNSETDPVSLLNDDDDDNGRGESILTTDKKPPTYCKREVSSTINDRKKSRKRTTLAVNDRRKKTAPPAAAASAFSSSSDDDDDLLESIQSTITRNTQKIKASTTNETKSKKKPRHETTLVDSHQNDNDGTSLTTTTKQKTAKQIAKEAAAAQKRQETQLAKQAAAAQRLQARQAKQLQQEAEKQAKQRQRQVCQQAAGKLAFTEIVILLDGVVLMEDDNEESPFLSHNSSGLPGGSSVQWIRNNALQGGAASAVEAYKKGDASGYEHIPVLTMVMTGESFLGLLQHDGEDDYPQMEAWILKLQDDWKKAWNTTAEPRIILLLDRVQEALENRWKNSRSKSALATMEELQDSLTWLLIQFRVESIRCKSAEELTYHVTKMTRLLAEAPYVQETTEIACVKKIPSELKYDDTTSTPEEQAQDCWLRQLQQIPNVSRRMALSFVQYYPTGVSLWRDYMDPTIDETSKRLLASTMFTDKRESRKLANQLYTVMTSQDPDHVL